VWINTYMRKELFAIEYPLRRSRRAIWRDAKDQAANTNPITAPFSIELPLFFLKIESVSQDHFSDQVVGRAGQTHAQSEVQFPLGRQIQIDRGKNLVLLLR
jgi:hypothetical protein